MRNFDIPSDNLKGLNLAEENVNLGLKSEEKSENMSPAVSERINAQALGDLSPEALSYIQQLEEELSSVKQVIFFHFEICKNYWLCLFICELLASPFIQKTIHNSLFK